MRQTRAILHCLTALILAAIVAVCSLPPSVASAQSVGNGGAPCQVNASLSAGNDNNNACRNLQASNGYYTALSSATSCGNVTGSSYGNGVTWTAITDPGYSNTEIIALPAPTTSPTPGFATPAFCSYNRTTGALTAGPVLANASGEVCYGTGSTIAHSEPELGDGGGGYAIGSACFSNANTPHTCLTASGAGGTGGYCAPVFWGNCVSTACGGAFTSDISSASNLGSLLTAGLAEGTVTHNYGYGGGIVTISGQNGGNVVAGSIAGQQAFTTLRDSKTTPGQWYEDTACSVGGTINATTAIGTSGSGGWNIVTSTGGGASPGGTGLAQGCNGTEQFSLPIHGSAMSLLDVTNDVNGATLSITLPTHGAWTSGICKFSLTGVGTADAPNLVAAMTTGAGWATGSAAGCSSSGTYWDSIAATSGGCSGAFPADANCNAPGATVFTVSIEPINANPNAMAASAVSVTSGAASIFDMRAANGGTFDHFNYGTFSLLRTPLGTPFYCALLDNQMGRTPAPSAIGTVNSLAFDMQILCSHGPDLNVTGGPGTLGVWIFGDAGIINPAGPNDGFSYAISPATLGAPPVGSTPSPAPYQQFQLGSAWTQCTTTGCTGYPDASGTAQTSYGWVLPCVCTPWSGFQPYVYQSSNRNQDITNGGFSDTSGNPAPILSSYALGIDQTLDFDIVRPCQDTNGSGSRIQLCLETINPFSAGQPQTIGESCIDCTNTQVARYLAQPAMVRAPSGDMVVLVGDQYGGLCNGTTHYPCLIQYVWKYNQTTLTYAASWTKTVLGSCPVSSITRGTAINTTVQGSWDGQHLVATCSATGATAAYQFDLWTGNL